MCLAWLIDAAMTAGRDAIKLKIYGLAVTLLAGLVLLRVLDVDRQLLKILAIASGLLVLLLLITYRAFAGVAEAARDGTLPPPPPDDDEDK
jgi:ABC-type transport system involved in cytochrome c biogenesis permease subunit